MQRLCGAQGKLEERPRADQPGMGRAACFSTPLKSVSQPLKILGSTAGKKLCRLFSVIDFSEDTDLGFVHGDQ